jgi:hypothetical protein
MKKEGSKKILKLITIGCFVILLSGFISLKSGVFDKKQDLPGTGLSLPTLDIDKYRDETLIMSSSKSAIVVEPNRLTWIREKYEDDSYQPGK